jgi:hypothetical protein
MALNKMEEVSKNFQKANKDLSSLSKCQRTDKYKNLFNNLKKIGSKII